MQKKLPFLHKILLIAISTIIVVLVLYFVQSIIFINSGKVDLTFLSNNSYRSEKNNYQLVFNSEESLTLSCPVRALSKDIEIYTLEIETKGDVIIAKNEEKKFVLIPVSEDRIFLQTRDVMLYNVEYIKLLQEQQSNEEAEV